MLGILGRGIQRNVDNEHPDMWFPTDDLVVSGPRGATLADAVQFDDNDPNGMVGGGRLNLLAGYELYKQLEPAIVACEYGNRSKYLTDVGGPGGSMIYAAELKKLAHEAGIKEPNISVFDEEEWGVEGSSTIQELHNMFTLALRHNVSEVNLVTVLVHKERTSLIAQRHQLTTPDFARLTIQTYASENVLLEATSEKYAARVHRMLSSNSYVRTAGNERFGINKVLMGNLGSFSSVTATEAVK
jgi:hypothetical protein